MGSSFNPQILVEKLAKLNSSQASIETLSHWCIFHMNKAKHVVEVWARQFHCSPREQRLAFLYLANDILQNSRRKGSEFVGEFWRVLPDAIRDVVHNGDEAGRASALRLISIWDERKVFGSRGQMLKEEFVGKHLEDNNKNGRHVVSKLKPPVANTVDRIISGYHVVYGRQLDENIIFSKCRNAMSVIEKVDKEGGSSPTSGSSVLEEVQDQHGILRDCIEQLKTLESSREALVSYLREALQDQELKLEQVQKELQVAQSRSEQAANICKRFLNSDDAQMVADQNSKESQTSVAPPNFISIDREQSAPVMYTQQQQPYSLKSAAVEEDHRKSAAAAVAAKLTASTSSAQMLSYVLSSLASEGVIGNAVNESSGDYAPEKRPKFENEQQQQQQYIPTQNLPRPPESHQPNTTSATSQPSTQNEAPPPPSSPPPQPPLPPVPHYPVPPYVPPSGSVNGLPYSYGIAQQQASSLSGYPMMFGPPTPQFTIPLQNPFQGFQGAEGFSSQPSSRPAGPVSRQ